MRRYAAVLAVALGLVACGGGQPEATTTPSPAAAATETVAATATPTVATTPTATATSPPPTTPPTQPANGTVPTATLVEAFPGLDSPMDTVALHQVPGSGVMVAVSQSGRLITFPLDGPYDDPGTALDISDELATGFELGLLSLAFDPNFESNGFVYLYYSVRDPALRTLVVRMTGGIIDGRFAINMDDRLTILAVEQPFENHNGGTLAFGPDGMLYLGVGDGGSGGDPRGYGQDTGENLLGTIIRIDVRGSSPSEKYAVPSSNPFVDDPGVLDETFTYGLRNPWRMSFDAETGELWVGDVGQRRFEEVDIVRGGENFGWNIMEGPACFEPNAGCDATGLTLPVAAYAHSLGCSIIGGYVYRGEAVPALRGYYVYGDFCSGAVWALDAAGAAAGVATEPVLLWEDGPGMLSFAVDTAGELYLLSTGGDIYRFAP